MPTAPERLLVLSMLRRNYGFRVDDLRGVEGILPVRTVPGAPDGVLGLVEQRGRIRTLVDLELLLNEPRTEADPVTVHLAPPHGQLSFRTFARLELAEGCFAENSDGTLAFREPDGEEIHMLSPARLLDRIQHSVVGF